LQLNENKQKQEIAILAGLASPVLPIDESASDETLDELEEHLKTAGGICAAKVLQRRASPEARTLLGEGKLLEIAELAKIYDAELIVVDNELSPSQSTAIEKLTGLRVMDRASLILDIFANRARSSEGKLQVELAQYRYLLPRLTGMWTHLVRQTASGGSSPIGTRGPGETQLETDRRHIRRRIQKLESELENVRRERAVRRHRRENVEIPVAALIGYTNAGKSTLLNALTDAGIQAENRLFDTLDPTIRKLKVSDTLEILVSDTVGFIHKLPHNLIDAFRATLEELEYSDVLLHVIDLSNPQWQKQAEVVRRQIHELKVDTTPVIEVFNKADMVEAELMPHGADMVVISAKTGAGLDNLKALIAKHLGAGRRRVIIALPYSEAKRLDVLYNDARVENVEYLPEVIEILAVCEPRTLGWIRNYIKEDRGAVT
jgi:GTP-binding protein HflX